MNHRVIVGALIVDADGRVLLLKMPEDRGVYPGQWGIVGGGIDEGEQAEAALQREVAEETGLTVSAIRPFWFHDEVREKLNPDGETSSVYMIYLLYDCVALDPEVVALNEEWEAYEWVGVQDLGNYDLNAATIKTFSQKGWL